MTAKINIIQDAMHQADALSSRGSYVSGLGSVSGTVLHQELAGIDGSEADLNDLDSTEIIDVQQKGSMPGETELFAGACELSDQGFGDFDVCLTVLTAKRGNMKLAKNALSKVIFSK